MLATSSARGARPRVRSSAALSVIDQGISSVTNFGVVVVAAVTLSQHGFGIFSVTYMVYGFVVPALEALVGQELVVRRGSDQLETECRDALVLTTVVAALIGLLLAGVGWFIPGLRAPFMVLGMFLPLLAAQDIARFAASSLGRMHVAVFADGLWLVISVGALVGAKVIGIALDATGLTLVWAAAGALAGAAVLPFFRVRSHRSRASLSRFRTSGYLGYRFLAEYVVLRGTNQLMVLSLGALAGVATAGAFRGATALFGPMNVLILAAASFGAPIIVSTRRGVRERAVVLGSAAMAVLVSVVATVIVLTPDRVGIHVLGDSWSASTAFVLPIAAQTMCTAFSLATFLALRLTAPKDTLKVRAVPAALSVPFFYGAYAMAGAQGAAWSIAVTAGLQGALGLRHYLRIRAMGHGLAAVA